MHKRACLVQYLLNRFYIKCLVRSLTVAVMYQLFRSPTNDCPLMNCGSGRYTFEGVKPRLDAGSVSIVKLTAYPYSIEGSQRAEDIGKKRCVRGMCFSVS